MELQVPLEIQELLVQKEILELQEQPEQRVKMEQQQQPEPLVPPVLLD
jgi:hypothetical protein